jgi:hypothetical protein
MPQFKFVSLALLTLLSFSFAQAQDISCKYLAAIEQGFLAQHIKYESMCPASGLVNRAGPSFFFCPQNLVPWRKWIVIRPSDQGNHGQYR